MASFNEIHGFVTAVRQRLARTRAVEGLAITSLVLMGLLAAGVLAAWVAGEPHLFVIRWTTLLFSAGTLLVGVLRYGVLPWRKFRRDVAVARRIESVIDLGGSVLSCVELEAQLSELNSSQRFDIGLVQALASDTARRLGKVQPADIVSWHRSARLSQALGAVSAVLVLAVLVFPEPFSEGAAALMRGVAPTAQRIRAAKGETRDVVVGDITVSLTYPAYTRRSTRVLRNTAGDVSALIGTRLRLETRSLEPVTEAVLVFNRLAEPLRLEVRPDGTLVGELTVRETGMYHVEIVRPDGTRVTERARRIVEAEPDLGPEVDLLQPVEDVEVEKLDPVKLHFSASDDYGLAGVDLVTEIMGAPEPAVRRRAVTLNGERTHVGEASVDLRQAGALPGDTVIAWLEVYDTNTVAEEPGRTRSRKVRIKLHSPEERHKEIIEKERLLLDLMIDLLADRLESPIEHQRRKRFNRILDRQGQINRLTKRFIEAFQVIVAALAKDPLARDGHRLDLAQLLEQHEGLYNREQHLIAAALGEARKAERVQHLAVLFRANETAIEQLEHDIIMLDRIIDEQHQQRMVDMARRLKERHQQLMDLLTRLKDNDDPELKMQMMQQIDRLMRQIERLRRDMRSNAKPAPYENMNVDSFQANEQMRDLESMEGMLEQIKRLVQEGKIDEAIKLAEALANQVQELSTALESDLANMEQTSNSRRSEELQRTLREMEKIQAREESINRQTAGLEEAADKELSKLVREEMVPRIAGVMDNISELQRKLSAVDPKDLHADDHKAMQEVAKRLAGLRETLSQEDMGPASGMAREIQKQLEELRDEVQLGAEKMQERQGNTPGVGRRKRNARRIKKSVPAARRIARELKAMMPTPDDLLDRRQKRRMQRLAERQRRNQERLQRMRGNTGELDEEAPGLGAELSEKLDAAEKAMERAEQSLRKNQPGKAARYEKEALDKLGEARRAVEKQLAPPERKGTGGGAGFGKDQVEIPDEERYSVPKEFRQRLLQGMGSRAPKRYKPLIQRYYEALVQ